MAIGDTVYNVTYALCPYPKVARVLDKGLCLFIDRNIIEDIDHKGAFTKADTGHVEITRETSRPYIDIMTTVGDTTIMYERQSETLSQHDLIRFNVAVRETPKSILWFYIENANLSQEKYDYFVQYYTNDLSSQYRTKPEDIGNNNYKLSKGKDCKSAKGFKGSITKAQLDSIQKDPKSILKVINYKVPVIIDLK